MSQWFPAAGREEGGGLLVGSRFILGVAGVF